jgi:hypothetical protein
MCWLLPAGRHEGHPIIPTAAPAGEKKITEDGNTSMQVSTHRATVCPVPCIAPPETPQLVMLPACAALP